MNDKLKPNQEKRIIENCVESIMDDLDYYHFDEKLMNKYEKQLIEFFTKISEEHSLFKTGFDFSNKKNIVNDKEKLEALKSRLGKKMTLTDKEKIDKALKEIDELIKHYERMKNAMKEDLADMSIEDLEGIKKILEDN